MSILADPHAGASSADPVALRDYERLGQASHAAVLVALQRAGQALLDLADSRPEGVWPHLHTVDQGRAHVDEATLLGARTTARARAFAAADGLALLPVVGARSGVRAPDCREESGGAFLGTDGASYPVVAPYRVVDGRREYLQGPRFWGDAPGTDGAEQGWVTVGGGSGLAVTETPGWGRFAAGAVTLGAAQQIVANRTAQEHHRMDLRAGGGAVLPRGSRGGAVRPVAAPPPDADRAPVTSPRTAAAARVQRGYGASGLGVALMSGLALGAAVRQPDVVVRQVVLEQHADGRRRARVLHHRVVELPPEGGRLRDFALDTDVAWQLPDGSWEEDDAGRPTTGPTGAVLRATGVPFPHHGATPLAG